MTAKSCVKIVRAPAAVSDVLWATQSSFRLHFIFVVDTIDVALPFPGFFDKAVFELLAYARLPLCVFGLLAYVRLSMCGCVSLHPRIKIEILLPLLIEVLDPPHHAPNGMIFNGALVLRRFPAVLSALYEATNVRVLLCADETDVAMDGIVVVCLA
jgi:hypothetical protein